MLTALVLTMAGCSSDDPTESTAPTTPEQAETLAQIIIDVRSAAEFDTGHIEGAVNIPHDEIGTRIAEVTKDKDQAIVLYCRSGGRAGIALAAVQELGYTQVENAGGYQSLKERLGQ
ncbi:MAG: rhodanese-like domain-containing protein [Planctomycetes bacterium]|nr:rhodanese-like domain-containing protein [Planctomycetota bacterium]